MIRISSNGIITVNRGDSFDLPILLRIGTSMDKDCYKLTSKDIIYVGIMQPNQPFETAILRKKFVYSDLDTSGNIVIHFKPSDTACLLPGKYYYQVKLEMYDVELNDWRVETIIDKTLFYIKE